MKKKKKEHKIIEQLEKKYPDATCSLEYHKDKPYELLIATRLSAQCTDLRVNIVTKPLFERYTTLQQIAEASLSDVEDIIKSCGLYKVKAKDTIAMCKMLQEEYHGVLPDSIDELTKLPGIGRKTANLIVGDIYHKPAIVCDTHCIRITNLLGLTIGTSPLSVEKQLREILPPEKSNDFCHRMVLHGRETCVANRPKCHACCV
ncbi:MAG: endonuclease III, partial [Oscillospiraceae bacterium]